jgi:hypothetical protein
VIAGVCGHTVEVALHAVEVDERNRSLELIQASAPEAV